MNKHANHNKLRLGKMPSWQRWLSYIFFSLCLLSGLIWFVLVDFLSQLPHQVKIWWLVHGISSLICFILLGAALPQHVSITWRSKRNRLGGGIATAILFFLLISSLFLFYGWESVHEPIRCLHIGLGLLLAIFFPWHIIRGRQSVTQLDFIKR